MSVAAGLAVMQAMFDAEINAIAGSKGKPTHMMRRESSRGSVTLGGRGCVRRSAGLANGRLRDESPG